MLINKQLGVGASVKPFCDNIWLFPQRGMDVVPWAPVVMRLVMPPADGTYSVMFPFVRPLEVSSGFLSGPLLASPPYPWLRPRA